LTEASRHLDRSLLTHVDAANHGPRCGLDYEFRGGLSAERKKEVDASGDIADVLSVRLNPTSRAEVIKASNRIFPARAWAVNQASS
jgi:hypothetical protein